MTITEPDTSEQMTPERADAERRKNAQIEAAMKADGVATETKVQHDYFGTNDVTKNVPLPRDGGLSWVTIQILNEGQRKKYQNQTNRDITVQKVSQNMIVKMAPGDERWALLEAAIVGWNLVSGGQSMTFNERNLKTFLGNADTKTIDAIEKAVRLANPWLLGEASAEDIRKEIADLEELLAKKIEEEAGNGPS